MGKNNYSKKLIAYLFFAQILASIPFLDLQKIIVFKYNNRFDIQLGISTTSGDKSKKKGI